MELKGAGWVDAERYRGVFVTRLAAQRILDSLELRAVLEGYIARRCCQRISREGIGQLRENVQRFKAVITRNTNDPEKDKLDQAFHERLAAIAGNKAMAETVAAIRVLDYQFLHDFDEYAESTWREHHDVLEAIADDRADDAERLMREQILALRRRVEAAIERGELPFVEPVKSGAR
jgi:DNA-binding GntR family transcriptional regulator